VGAKNGRPEVVGPENGRPNLKKNWFLGRKLEQMVQT